MAKLTKEEFIENVKKHGKAQDIVVLEFLGVEKKCKIFCKRCNSESIISRANELYRARCCHTCGKKTRIDSITLTKEDFIENIKKHGNAEDIELIGEYSGILNKVLVKCKRCNTEFVSTAYELYRHRCCPTCREEKSRVRDESNLICKRQPYLINFMLDKNIAYKYTCGSGKRICWVCPICKNRFEKQIYRVASGGFKCPVCGGAMSYGERIVNSILTLLGEKFIKQARFDWAKSEFDKYFYYDFYVPEYSLIIEVMGEQHENENSFFKVSLEDQISADKIKETLANNNGIKHYIKLKYLKNDFDTFMKEILDSNIIKFFDISILDVNKIKLYSAINLEFFRCVKEFNEDPRSMKKLARDLGINSTKTRRYIKIASENGLCNYSKEMTKDLTNKYRKINKYSVKVSQYKLDGTFIKDYESYSKASDENNVSGYLIKKCVYGKNKTAGGYVWKLYNKEE